MLLEPSNHGTPESACQLRCDEISRKLLYFRGREAREIRLVLLHRMDAADGQITQQEEGIGQELPRPLPPACPQETPKSPFGAARKERPVDVEYRKIHYDRR
jgi:hypothetical protein